MTDHQPINARDDYEHQQALEMMARNMGPRGAKMILYRFDTIPQFHLPENIVKILIERSTLGDSSTDPEEPKKAEEDDDLTPDDIHSDPQQKKEASDGEE